MFSYISLEDRVPAKHPLRELRAVVDGLLASMTPEFEAVYSRNGRPSVTPEMLLKALLLQILFSIRSERRLLVEAIAYNLLYRWFVGLNLEDKVWNHSTFSANRERLFNEDLARVFFERVEHTASWAKLNSDEHFSGDGTLIEAWASHKSLKRKDDDIGTSTGRNPEVDFKGQPRSNNTHTSTTDADARLFKKAAGDKSCLCHMGHILMENRNGLIVDVEITHASGTAEREAALNMLARQKRKARRLTVGADKGYDCKALVKGCRKLGITPHVAAKAKHSAIDGRTQRHEGYKTSLRIRKRIEEAFGWIKTVGDLAKTKLIGQALMCYATYNLGSAWAPSVACGMRIMRESRSQCVRNGQKGLQQAPTRAAEGPKYGHNWLQTDAGGASAALMNTFSTAC
jgi:transposase